MPNDDGKFNLALMYKLSEGMKTSAEDIENLYKELVALIENSKEVWNDEISMKFFEELNLAVSYLHKFIQDVPNESRLLKERTDKYAESYK